VAENRHVAGGVAGVSFCTPYRSHVNVCTYKLFCRRKPDKQKSNLFQFNFIPKCIQEWS
jgi:hypothetical protein